jgi:aquaporin Z
MDPKKYLAEGIGTFVLVVVGSMTIVSAITMEAPVLATVPWGFGLALMAGILALGPVSGGHFNPAVTIAMVLDRRTTGIDSVGYIVAQLIGAIAASGVILLLGGNAAVVSTTSQVGALTGGLDKVGVALTAEVTLTAIFLLVILTVTKRAPNVAGIVIGLTLAAAHFAAIPLSGASLNPARTLGPAIVSGSYADIWVWIVGPIVGGIVGWAVYRIFMPAPEPASGAA